MRANGMNMNKMTLFFLLLCPLFLTSCSEDSNVNSAPNPLEGTSWTCSIGHQTGTMNVVASIDFYPNSKCTVTTLNREYYRSSASGTYSVNGENVSFGNFSVKAQVDTYIYITFSFTSGTFTNSIMHVNGSMNSFGNITSHTWDFKKQ